VGARGACSAQQFFAPYLKASTQMNSVGGLESSIASPPTNVVTSLDFSYLNVDDPATGWPSHDRRWYKHYVQFATSLTCGGGAIIGHHQMVGGALVRAAYGGGVGWGVVLGDALTK